MDKDIEGQRPRSTLEGRIGMILQGVAMALILWIGTSVLDLNKTAIRLEERYMASQATGTRVEQDVAAIRNQLQTMNTAIQSGTFRTESLENRMKHLELMKERMR